MSPKMVRMWFYGIFLAGLGGYVTYATSMPGASFSGKVAELTTEGQRVSARRIDVPETDARYLRLTRPYDADLRGRDAFTIYMCVSGSARVKLGTGLADMETGQTLLISAAATGIRLETDGCELLEVTL